MEKLKMTWIKEKKAPLLIVSGLCLVLAAGLGTGLWLASEKEEDIQGSTGRIRRAYGWAGGKRQCDGRNDGTNL